MKRNIVCLTKDSTRGNQRRESALSLRSWRRLFESVLLVLITISAALPAYSARSRDEGWDSGNAASATTPDTFRGPSIFRGNIGAVRSLAFNPLDNPGSGNFHIAIPLVQAPGRGISLSITMNYNSQLWTRHVIDDEVGMSFDLDGDWPSPGWTISFGKIVVISPTQSALFIEGNGLRHKAEFLYDQQHPTDPSLKRHWARTIDGSFILYAYDDKPGTGLVGGYARYPDGRETWFAARNQKGNAIYMTKSRDVHGNFISIKYRGDRGPALEQVDDTSGRVFKFHYDTRGELITIKGPSLGGTIKPLVKFGYRGELKVACHFKQLISGDRPTIPQLLAYVYFPTNGSVYHVQEYDPCGYITGIGQYVGAKYSGGNDIQEGTLDPGRRIRLREYLYNKPPNGWTQPPNYNQVRETISQPNGPEIVAKSSVVTGLQDNTLTVTTLPDGTKIREYSFSKGEFAGLQDLTEIVSNGWGNDSIQSTKFYYSGTKGDWGVPRPKQITYSVKYGPGNAPGHHITKLLSYVECMSAVGDHCFNAVSEIRTNTGATGAAGLDWYHISKEKLEYLPYGFKLPTKREMFQCKPGATDSNDPNFDCQDLLSKTVLTYDDYSNTSLIQVLDAKGFEHLAPTQRGNVTKIERYALTGDDERTFGPQNEFRQYDETGNIRKLWGSCCIASEVSYSKATEYTFPETLVSGKSGDPKLSVSNVTTYDMSTGLLTSTRSKAGTQDNRIAITYETSDPLNLRVTKTLPTGATIITTIKDSGIQIDESVFVSAGTATAGKTVFEYNGLGLLARTTMIGVDETKGDVSELLYDELGRVAAESQPYSLERPNKYWTRYTYDALGRITRVTDANDKSTNFYFNETRQVVEGPNTYFVQIVPKAARSEMGETVRIEFPTGVDRWQRVDPFGRVSEVVELGRGTGKILETAQNATQYSTLYTYDARGLLTGVDQQNEKSFNSLDRISQQRAFLYDGLGRLIAQSVPEKAKTLTLEGRFDRAAGKYSDVFVYDAQNLIRSYDARGTSTWFDYAGPGATGADPLNRLFAINYDKFGFGDTENPILQDDARPVKFEHWPAADGNPMLMKKVSRAPTYPEALSYDPYGLLTKKTITNDCLVGGLTSMTMNYGYDALGRLSTTQYPDLGTSPQGSVLEGEKLTATYGLHNRLANLSGKARPYVNQISYNQFGLPTKYLVGSPRPIEQEDKYYPQTGELESQLVVRPYSTRRDDVLKLSYHYNAAQQIEAVRDYLKVRGPAGGYFTMFYKYDSANRLLTATAANVAPLSEPPGTDPGWLWQQQYAYDFVGNRLGVASTNNSFNDGIASLDWNFATNRILSAGFKYDAAGNQIRSVGDNRREFRHVYDIAGRLSETATISNPNSYERYDYDHTGGRVSRDRVSYPDPQDSQKKVREFTCYFREGHQVLAEHTVKVAEAPSGSTTSKTWKHFVYLGNRLLATSSGLVGKMEESVDFHFADRLGEKAVALGLLIDGRPNVSQMVLPFGNVIKSETTLDTERRFTTYERSSLSGVDYAFNRFYDPQQGRFMQPDPIGAASSDPSSPQSWNLYSYVGNDPVNFADPSGLAQMEGGGCYTVGPEGQKTTMCPGSSGGFEPVSTEEEVVVIGKRGPRPGRPPPGGGGEGGPKGDRGVGRGPGGGGKGDSKAKMQTKSQSPSKDECTVFAFIGSGKEPPLAYARPATEAMIIGGYGNNSGWYKELVGAVGGHIGSHADNVGAFRGTAVTSGHSESIYLAEGNVGVEAFSSQISVGGGFYATEGYDVGAFAHVGGGVFGKSGFAGVGAGTNIGDLVRGALQYTLMRLGLSGSPVCPY